MTATEDMTVREIVANDFRSAEVFQRHGIDFCCRGNRSLEDACRSGGISVERILREVTEITAPPTAGGPRFNSWDLATLVSYIQANHHAFVRRTIPVLRTHTEKVAKVHGDAHPELREVARLVALIADEMTSHMAKEEHILFPYIVALEQAVTANNSAPATPFGTVRNPIRMMEAEHESSGDAMARIRDLTSGYAVPEGACTTYRVCLQELEAFERDLHEHVHLENNILFPRALQLESEAW
jgi:regulator of cell morphogenesis and NO signaling